MRSAADDLHVVYGAVSQQVRLLEDELGASLFDREGRRLVLTENGRRFAKAVQDAFGIIERAANELTPLNSKRAFRLGVMATFGAHWMVPRLPFFLAANPGLDIELVTVPVLKNLEDTNLDAVIVGSDYEPRPELVGTKFMDDVFGPVATPELIARTGITEHPASLANAVAIGTTSQPKLWDAWFLQTGTPALRFTKRRELDDMSLSIEAARAGLGVALLPRPYVVEDIRSSRLVAPFGFATRAGGFYFCCRRCDSTLSMFEKVRDWLVMEGKHYVLDGLDSLDSQ
jgi:DNA-binding transcriptional LysR family regulator